MEIDQEPLLETTCPFCGSLVEEERRYAYPLWRCSCGAIAAGAQPCDLDEAADQLIDVLGLDFRASQPCLPVGESGLICATPYDAALVQQTMEQQLPARGFETRRTRLPRSVTFQGRTIDLGMVLIWARQSSAPG
jgi:hypothetical protein